MIQTEQAQWTKQDLLAVAKNQETMTWLILLFLLAGLIPGASIIAGIILLRFIYKTAVAVRSRVAWVYPILAMIPFVGFIALFCINLKATNILRRHGIRVGLMGATMSDFDNRDWSA